MTGLPSASTIRPVTVAQGRSVTVRSAPSATSLGFDDQHGAELAIAMQEDDRPRHRGVEAEDLGPALVVEIVVAEVAISGETAPRP